MEAIIYIKPPTTYMIIGNIAISGSTYTFHKNIYIYYIYIYKYIYIYIYICTYEGFLEYILRTLPLTYPTLSAVNDDGDNLILIINGQMLFYKSVFLKHRKYNQFTFFYANV